VVGIAVSNVGMLANEELVRDLVTNVIVTTLLRVNYVDEGVLRFKLLDVDVENLSEVCTHGVVEGDVDLAFFKAIIGSVATKATCHRKNVEDHGDEEEKC
jgi:hypothetical protein